MYKKTIATSLMSVLSVLKDIIEAWPLTTSEPLAFLGGCYFSSCPVSGPGNPGAANEVNWAPAWTREGAETGATTRNESCLVGLTILGGGEGDTVSDGSIQPFTRFQDKKLEPVMWLKSILLGRSTAKAPWRQCSHPKWHLCPLGDDGHPCAKAGRSWDWGCGTRVPTHPYPCAGRLTQHRGEDFKGPQFQLPVTVGHPGLLHHWAVIWVNTESPQDNTLQTIGIP